MKKLFKRPVFYILIAGFLLVILFHTSTVNTLRVTAYYTGPEGDQGYYFALNQNGVLSCKMGEGLMKLGHVNFPFLMRDYGKVKLNDNESKRLIDLADKIDDIGIEYPESVAWGGWNIIFYYKGNSYNAAYLYDESEEINSIVDRLIELSPISVDFQFWRN